MKQLKSGCWNIRRGLIKRELEITNLLTTEKLDIFFLVETDTNMIHSENDYKIKGYKTVFPLKDGNNLKTRMICLTNESNDNIKTRPDLMDPKFPSIWCEEVREHEKNLLICGFYREWSHEGLKSNAIQLEAIKIFCGQIEKASKENKNIIIQGDANLCADKWSESDFNLSYLSDELIGTLSQCGLLIVNLGKTYLADRLNSDGLIIESALDHT